MSQRKERLASFYIGRSFEKRSIQIKVIFKIGHINFEAELNNSITAENIIKRLPWESTVSWGKNEIILDIEPIAVAEKASFNVKVGDIAFWPEGRRLCIFLDLQSAGGASRIVSDNPVVIVGETLAFPEELKEIKAGERAMLSLFAQPARQENKAQASGERKLSQAEIDLLVKQLLEAKNKPLK